MSLVRIHMQVSLVVRHVNSGEYAVSDTQQFNHSLEEVLWILSF